MGYISCRLAIEGQFSSSLRAWLDTKEIESMDGLTTEQVFDNAGSEWHLAGWIGSRHASWQGFRDSRADFDRLLAAERAARTGGRK
jgi:hypothetical protein